VSLNLSFVTIANQPPNIHYGLLLIKYRYVWVFKKIEKVKFYVFYFIFIILTGSTD